MLEGLDALQPLPLCMSMACTFTNELTFFRPRFPHLEPEDAP